MAHWQLLLWCGYGLVVAAGLARLLVGVVSTVRLYRASIPIKAPWTENRHVRICNRITGPVSCGSCIILPGNYRDWSAKKLAAVLAHEQAHLDRGDFFIQLLAALHRILFWFSPFAWWLQIRLAFLAEAASDEAAVRVLNDRAYYAEVLLEMSRKAQGVPLLVAMTKRGGVQQRILQILDDALPASAPSASARAMLVVAILPLAGLLAGARANVPLDAGMAGSAAHLLQSRLVEAPPVEISPRIAVGQHDTRSKPVRRTKVQSPEARPQAATPETVAVAAPVPDKDEASYNPRALLQGSGVAIVSTIIPVVPDDQQKTNRSAPALLDLRSGDHDSQ